MLDFYGKNSPFLLCFLLYFVWWMSKGGQYFFGKCQQWYNIWHWQSGMVGLAKPSGLPHRFGSLQTLLAQLILNICNCILFVFVFDLDLCLYLSLHLYCSMQILPTHLILNICICTRYSSCSCTWIGICILFVFVLHFANIAYPPNFHSTSLFKPALIFDFGAFVLQHKPHLSANAD